MHCDLPATTKIEQKRAKSGLFLRSNGCNYHLDEHENRNGIKASAALNSAKMLMGFDRAQKSML